MSHPALPPPWLAELGVPPGSPVEVRTLLERALDATVDLGGREAAVAVASPAAVEARATPGLDLPSPDGFRAIAAALRAGEPPPPTADGRTLVGHLHDAGEVQAIVLVDVEPADRERFDAWADVLLLALSRAGLVLQGRRRDREYARLQQTAQRVAASLDLDDVLGEIVRDAAELLEADSGDMLLVDEARATLRVVAVANFPSEMVGFEMDVGEGVSSRAIATRRAVIVNDYERYRHRVRRLDRYRFRAVVCAPLIARGESIGALNVHATTTERRFGQDDARLLTAFANHAAIAIDNARRYRNEVRLAEDLVQANRELERSLTLQQRVVRQVLMDRGLEGVAFELATHLARPVVIQDDFLRVLASAGEVSADLALVADAAGRDELLERARGSGEPIELGTDGVGAARRMAAPVRLGAEVAGFLTVPSATTLGSLDRALLEVAATGVALEFAKLRAQVALEQRLRGDVVGDLVAGSFASEASIAARAARIGLDVTDACDLIVVRPADGAADDVAADRLLERRRRFVDAVHAAAPSAALVAQHEDLAVVLVPARAQPERAASDLADRIVERVDEQLPDVRCIAAVGNRCRAPADHRRSFRLAVGALDALAKIGGSGRVVDAPRLGVARLLISAADASELHEFARTTLDPLLDGERHRELLSTLRAYVESGFNQRTTAKRAFVHFNTVAYRLRRIEQRLGVNLDDPHVRVDLTLALRIAALSGLLADHNPTPPEM